MDKIEKRSVGTHDGSFHADEVTACALLILFDCIDRDKIRRTRDPEILASCEYVCDVGGIYDPSLKRFDHHQVDYVGDHSSAGMVLDYLLSSGTLDERSHEAFKRSLIKGVDDHDNGKDPLLYGVCTFSHVIANFNTIEYEVTSEEQDAAFFEALEFVYGHLKRFWARHQYIDSCRELVAEAMKPREEVMFFARSIPWVDLFFELGGKDHPAKFLIMPTGGQWKLRGIPPTFEERMGVRQPLPEEWAGLLEGELKEVSGIEGAVFCHKGRFISVWETREAALEALDYVLKNK